MICWKKFLKENFLGVWCGTIRVRLGGNNESKRPWICVFFHRHKNNSNSKNPTWSWSLPLFPSQPTWNFPQWEIWYTRSQNIQMAPATILTTVKSIHRIFFFATSDVTIKINNVTSHINFYQNYSNVSLNLFAWRWSKKNCHNGVNWNIKRVIARHTIKFFINIVLMNWKNTVENFVAL